MKCAFALIFLYTTVSVAQVKQYKSFDNDIHTQWQDPAFSIPDSLDKYFIRGLKAAKSKYLNFYSLTDDGPNLFLYFDMGYHYSKDQKSAIVAFMLNDTTAWCDIYFFKGNRWKRSGRECLMHISGFHPAYFHATIDDHNFDGHKDVFLNFYHSMGVVYGYGYLMTYNPQTASLTLHPESINIASMQIDKTHKSILSIEYANPNATIENYRKIYRYKWLGDSLRLVSKRKIHLK